MVEVAGVVPASHSASLLESVWVDEPQKNEWTEIWTESSDSDRRDLSEIMRKYPLLGEELKRAVKAVMGIS